MLLLQIIVVILATLTCGWIARRLGQARVIGEMIGGILLGPSVFGRIAPHTSASLFPSDSLGSFEVLSNIGLILFLFLIGAELDYEHLRKQRVTATLSSTMSILLPFLLAIAAAPALHSRFAPQGVSRLPFTLFLGISMSITAFPVLARILEERGLHSTPLGATALMCAAVDDVFAWSLLAVALALIQPASGSISLLHRLLWLVLYLAGMLFVIRPLGKKLAQRQRSIALSYELFAAILVLAFLSADATEAIGVHPLFGAFFAGLCLPRVPSWQHSLRSRLDTIVSVLLLPLFFALTGIRTRLDLLAATGIWFWAAIVLLIAVAGKIGGAVIAARWSGQTWQHSLALGALLNTRGLVELIVLNIAYKAHVFSPTLFTMLVLMALITTMMTTPLLNWLNIKNREVVPRDLSSTNAA